MKKINKKQKLVAVDLFSGAELLATSPTGRIDLIAACPPCQSFSSLTAKYKREISFESCLNKERLK
jgi:site-specific DNA-cytosine methylase